MPMGVYDRPAPIERFKKYILRDKETGCMVWTGAKVKGYGKFGVKYKTVLTHKWFWEYFHGPVPEGLELDHLCRNRACCNPDHLEPVTHRENIRRGNSGKVAGARQRSKTNCPHGHPYNEENTYRFPDGRRACRSCFRIRRKGRKSKTSI